MCHPSIYHGPSRTAGASGSQREEEQVQTLSRPTLRDKEAPAHSQGTREHIREPLSSEPLVLDNPTTRFWEKADTKGEAHHA